MKCEWTTWTAAHGDAWTGFVNALGMEKEKKRKAVEKATGASTTGAWRSKEAPSMSSKAGVISSRMTDISGSDHSVPAAP